MALRCDDDIIFCGAHLNAGNAGRREINGVVRLAGSCGNVVVSGNQIISTLIRRRVGEKGLGHTHSATGGACSPVTRTEHVAPSPSRRAQGRAIVCLFVGDLSDSYDSLKLIPT